MLTKITFIIAGMAVSFAAYGQGNANTYTGDLGKLPGLENTTTSRGARSNSPSQVVILNNVPNHKQKQNQESAQGQNMNQRASLRQGWGTGDSLEDLRRRRAGKEEQNEQVLMEKLEESRMEDEKRRLKRLFKIRQYNQSRYNDFGDEFEMEVEQTQSVRVKKPTVIVADAAPTVAAPSVHTRTSYYADMEKKHYLKGQIGIGEYKAADNAKGTASWGVAVGKDLNPKLSFELGVFKTSYEVNDPLAIPAPSRYRNLDQYNVTGVLGYKVINVEGVEGTLRGGLSYVRRASESADWDGFQKVKSNTVDGVIGVGASFKLTPKISVVGSFDYYKNIINNIASTNLRFVDSVETSDYYVLGAGLKLRF